MVIGGLLCRYEAWLKMSASQESFNFWILVLKLNLALWVRFCMLGSHNPIWGFLSFVSCFYHCYHSEGTSTLCQNCVSDCFRTLRVVSFWNWQSITHFTQWLARCAEMRNDTSVLNLFLNFYYYSFFNWLHTVYGPFHATPSMPPRRNCLVMCATIPIFKRLQCLAAHNGSQHRKL